MAETLTVQMSGNINATLGYVVGVDTLYDNAPISVVMTLNTGVGEKLANQMFTDQRTLTPGASFVTDLVTFNGSNDKVGNPLAMANVKLLYIFNTGTVPGWTPDESQKLVVGGSPAGARGWTTVLNGTGTINGTSGFLVYDPGNSGYPVPSGNGNNLFKITNTSAASIQYSMMVIGSTGTV